MSDSKQIMDPAQLPKDPLAEVWNVITPLLMPERAEHISAMVKGWVKEELQTYAAIHNTDDVQCGIELTYCKAKFDLPDVGPLDVKGYRLFMQVTGTEPQHPQMDVDCFFVENQVSKLVDNIILSKPKHNASDTLQ
jgi:hypothetical protein